MPYLKIQTDGSVENEKQVVEKASTLVASELGKPESYVMVALEPEVAMSFGGEYGSAAFMQLKSIGLDESETEGLSSALGNFAEEELGVDRSRVYIEFADVAGPMWGWKGTTF
ncbi:MAG: phenylpyruvate tautomerase MIF-related protein [Bacillota bacterium]